MSIIFDFIPMIRLILQIQEALSVDNSSLQSLQLYLITTININMVTAKLTAVTVGSYAQHTFLLLNSTNLYLEFLLQTFEMLRSNIATYWSISDPEESVAHE
jgi:hypothetical protein